MATFSGCENDNPSVCNAETIEHDAITCWAIVAEVTRDDYDNNNRVDTIEENCTEIEKQNILFAECMWIKGWREQ